jgi:hypothetical protein
MKHNRKSQVALEFLTTYGWAIMVVMIMIGALAYFGIFNIQEQLPERCNFGVQLNCGDWLISEADENFGDPSVKMYIRNNFQEGITISRFTVNSENYACNCSSSSTIYLESGDTAILEANDCEGCSSFFNEGDKVKLEGAVKYIKQTGKFNHTQKGEIFATIMP